jgi:hypothetical protein
MEVYICSAIGCSRIARCNEEGFTFCALLQFPSEGMFSATGSKEKNVHAIIYRIGSAKFEF